MIRWVVVVSLVAVAGCRDGSSSPPDATLDAYENVLGTACTGMGRGSCPFGFSCITLNLAGGTSSFCARPCDPASDTCSEGYMGPGLAKCIVVTSGAGSGPDHCGIVCREFAGGQDPCAGSSACDGTCPSNLTCDTTDPGIGFSACI